MLGYFERALEKNGGRFTVGNRLSYVDLSLFQVVEGLRYAFPKRMKRYEKNIPGLVGLHDRVAQAPADQGLSRLEAADSVEPVGIYRYFKNSTRDSAHRVDPKAPPAEVTSTMAVVCKFLPPDSAPRAA